MPTINSGLYFDRIVTNFDDECNDRLRSYILLRGASTLSRRNGPPLLHKLFCDFDLVDGHYQEGCRGHIDDEVLKDFNRGRDKCNTMLSEERQKHGVYCVDSKETFDAFETWLGLSLCSWSLVNHVVAINLDEIHC